MADNVVLAAGGGTPSTGATVRALGRTTGASSGTETQVITLDIGGANTNAESLVSSTNGLPTAGVSTSLNFTGTPTSGATVIAATACGQYASCALNISGTWTGQIQVQVSIDNGTTWRSLSFATQGSPILGAVTTFTANPTSVAWTSLCAANQVRVQSLIAGTGTATVYLELTTTPVPVGSPLFASTAGTPSAIASGLPIALLTDNMGNLFVNRENRRATFTASSNGTPVVATAGPLIALIGNASNTVRITRIAVGISCTTGNATPAVITLKRYSALTGGTAVALTAVQHDTNSAAPVSSLTSYSTGVPTGTAVATIRSIVMPWVTSAAATPDSCPYVQWIFGEGGSQLVLRGTSQSIGLTLSTIGTTPTIFCDVEWTEDLNS